MKVYRPILPVQISQSFGDNIACVKLGADGQPIRPFIVSTTTTTCPVGTTSFYPAIGMKGHNGVDMPCWSGCPVYFPVDIPGVEWYAKNASDPDGGLGVDVISRSKVTLNGRTDYVKFRFWHFKASAVAEYGVVQFGQLLGLGNNTGASSGSHLHWSMKWCDKDGKSLDSTNGYYGATDFMPWYVNVYVLDEIKNRVPAPICPTVPQQDVNTLVNKIFFLVGEFLVKLLDLTKK